MNGNTGTNQAATATTEGACLDSLSINVNRPKYIFSFSWRIGFFHLFQTPSATSYAPICGENSGYHSKFLNVFGFICGRKKRPIVKSHGFLCYSTSSLFYASLKKDQKQRYSPSCSIHTIVLIPSVRWLGHDQLRHCHSELQLRQHRHHDGQDVGHQDHAGRVQQPAGVSGVCISRWVHISLLFLKFNIFFVVNLHYPDKDYSEYFRKITQESVQRNNTTRLFSPPDGCLQYHTGLTGRIESFNYNAMNENHLDNQRWVSPYINPLSRTDVINFSHLSQVFCLHPSRGGFLLRAICGELKMSCIWRL